MSKLIDIDISDNMFKEMLNALKKDVTEKTALIDAEIGAYGELMATSAKNLVSGNDAIDTGRLLNSISLKKEQFLSYNLVAQTDYAAYIEFGTGTYAASYVPSLEKEWQDIAIKFKGKNDPSKPLPSRPYMRPSILAYQKPLKEAIIKILNK